jgi:hypothetical protein
MQIVCVLIKAVVIHTFRHVLAKMTRAVSRDRHCRRVTEGIYRNVLIMREGLISFAWQSHLVTTLGMECAPPVPVSLRVFIHAVTSLLLILFVVPFKRARIQYDSVKSKMEGQSIIHHDGGQYRDIPAFKICCLPTSKRRDQTRAAFESRVQGVLAETSLRK